ncbi:hypothetical protein [Rubrivirga sp.]
MIEFSDVERVEIHVGTVLSCEPNAKARRPAYVGRADLRCSRTASDRSG